MEKLILGSFQSYWFYNFTNILQGAFLLISFLQKIQAQILSTEKLNTFVQKAAVDKIDTWQKWIMVKNESTWDHHMCIPCWILITDLWHRPLVNNAHYFWGSVGCRYTLVWLTLRWNFACEKLSTKKIFFDAVQCVEFLSFLSSMFAR